MNTWGAEVLLANLKAQGIKYIFGIPGGKIDRVYDALLGAGIAAVVCRHEQNAAFIAAGASHQTSGGKPCRS
jgi:acetolactate synthase I/II/III large subunit